MLPPVMEGKIEDTVKLDLNYPSVTERYWTKYYFIPKEKKKPDTNGDSKQTNKGSTETTKENDNAEKMDVDTNNTNNRDNEGMETLQEDEKLNPQQEGSIEHPKMTYSSLDTSGHVCVMVHTNKLCLVTLASKHPALAPGMEITKVSYEVGKFNRLDNQVSGKGKRGAQMMGPQSPVCIITCADGSIHTVLAGIHGKLVEVNKHLLTNPKLVSERPDSEGYLAVILPPIRNGNGPLSRLISAQQYQELYS